MRTKRLALLLAAALVSAGIGVVASPPAHATAAASTLYPGPYRIVAYDDGSKCLDVTDVSYYNGALTQMYDCITAYLQYNQMFYLYPVQGGPYYNIVAAHSGKCLDVKDVSVANYAPIQQWDCYGYTQTNQVWSVITLSGNRTLFYPTHSWRPMNYAGLYNGASVYQFSASSTYWYLIAV